DPKPSTCSRPRAHRLTNTPGRVEEVQVEATPILTVAALPQCPAKSVASRSVSIRFSIDESAQKKLRYALELFSHRIRPGDLSHLFERALDALIREGEKRKCAATDQPRRSTRRANEARRIPASVRREIWERDLGQCTFLSDSGRRCGSRHFLEFDHVIPVAR